MKVIFRSNDHFAKKTLGQLGGAEEWLKPLNKYLSDSAVARLSLFEENNNISLATLDIIDGSIHVHSSVKSENKLTAVETAIKKCAVQLKKENNINNFSDSIRYYDNIDSNNLDEDLEVDNIIDEAFDLLEVEKTLDAEKKTPKYNYVMNKYINYLYRGNDIEILRNHLNILYTIYSNVDKETTTVADYERLTQSISELTEELYSMLEKQDQFENNTRDNSYIDYIIEQEATLAKLKR